jgi:hypothetical protein
LEGSKTVTEKVQLTVLPELSVTVAVTGVVPTRKLVPDAGLYITEDTPQLSVVVMGG